MKKQCHYRHTYPQPVSQTHRDLVGAARVAVGATVIVGALGIIGNAFRK